MTSRAPSSEGSAQVGGPAQPTTKEVTMCYNIVPGITVCTVPLQNNIESG